MTTKCEKRGCHRWEVINSTSEDCNEMDVETECLDCGASFCGRGEWSE